MTNETPKTEIAAETMVGDLMALVIQELKVLPKAWPAMSEDQQKEVIDRARAAVETAVHRCVRLVAAGDRSTLTAKLVQVTMKDGIKAVVELPKSTIARHELFDAQGGEVLVVILNSDQYAGGADDVKPDPQQPDLPIADANQRKAA